MAQVVGQLMIEMAANVARLQTDMAKATKTVDGAMAQIQKSVEVAKKALGGLVGIEVINRMAQATKAAIDMADGLGELAEKTGMSVKELSGLRVAFQLNGLQADQVAGAMKKLSVSVAKGADAFAAMGINTKNTDGTLKNTRQILGEVADQFASYRDGAAKTALAVNLFGKAGGDMVLLLNQGAEGLARFDEEARKLGIALDDSASAAAGRFNDEMDKLGFVIDAAWLRFSSQLLPVLTDVVTYFRNGEQQTTLFTGALGALATAIKAVYSIFVGFGFVLESTGKFLGNFVATFATLATDGIDAARRVKEEFKGEFAKDLENAANAINNAWSEIPQTIKSTGDAANDAAKKNAPAIKTLSKEIDAQGKAAKSTAKSMGVYSDAHIKTYEAYKKGSKAAEDLIDNIKQETAALKMSSQARAVANELRELEKTGLDTTSAAYKKYAAEVIKATTGREAVRKQIDEQEATRQRWTDLWADVGQSLTDSLMEGGKNAREYLEGTFRSMILRPTIEAAVNATIQSVTGAAIGQSVAQSATGQAIGTWLGPVVIAAAALGIMKDIGRQISGGRDIGGGALGEFADFLSLGTLSRAFGKGPYKLRSERLQGELGMGGADLEIVRRLKREGGVFSGDSRRTTRTAVEGQLLEFINKSIADMTSAAKTFAGAIGVSGDALTDFVYNVDISLKGLKPEEKEQRIMELMQEFNDAIARQLIPNIDSLSKDGETAAQTLERLSTNFQTVNQAMDLLNQSMFDTSIIGAQFATVLVDAFGGIEEFTQATSVFYDKFFTQAEKTVNVTDMLAREFGKLGLTVPATREEYRRLVEAQNRFTTEGAATYAQLIKLSGAFASVTAEIDAAATTLSQTMAEMVTDATRAAIDGLQDQIRATRDLAAESRDMARAYMDAATAIRATAQGLMFGRTGAPQSVLRQQYQSTLQMALGGDLTALQGVGGAASALVESVRGTATSRVDFIRQAALVQSQLEEAAKVADATAQAEITLAQLYDVNVDMMELTLRGIEEGTITNELLQENIAAINLVNASIKEQGGAEGNIVVTTLLTQILAATKKQSEAEAAAVAETAKQEALRQAEILRQQALAAEAIRKQQEAEAAAAAAIEQKRQDDISAVNRQAIEIQNRLNRTGGGFAAQIEKAQLRSQLAALREQIKALGGTPAFAGGGMHSGGLRLVGENGPELEATGPARIYNARQTAGMLSGGADMVAELRLLRQEVGELRYEARATATNTNKTQRLLERVTLDGEAMQTVAYS